jgi:hypothetical protein
MEEIGDDEEVVNDLLVNDFHLCNLLGFEDLLFVSERDCDLSTMLYVKSIRPENEVTGLIAKEEFHLWLRKPVLDLLIVSGIFFSNFFFGSSCFRIEDHLNRSIKRVREIQSLILMSQHSDVILFDELLQASKDTLNERLVPYLDVSSVARLVRFLALAFPSKHLSDGEGFMQFFHEWIESTQCLGRYMECQFS